MKTALAAVVLISGMLLVLLAGSPVLSGYAVASDAPQPGISGVLEASVAPAAPISFSMRGFNFPSWQRDDYLGQGSSDSLDRISATGANWIAIDPTQYVDTSRSTTIGPDPGGRTATDEAVGRAIDEAHARGLKVMLKPHVDVQDDSCRCDLNPANVGEWFSSYSGMITGYARLAQEHQVELLVVGTEFVSLSGPGNYDYWAGVISRVRSVYHGPLTYASGQDEYASLSFWGLLDYLGIDVYFPVSDAASPSRDELVAGWTDYRGRYGNYNRMLELEQWQAVWNKPVIFTELGYRSVDHSTRAPWDYSFPGIYDGALQARAIDAAFTVFNNKPWLAGVFWWNWRAADNGENPINTDYAVAGKPAEATLTAWYSSAEPQLTTTVSSATWSGLQDYQSGRLSVDFMVQNVGNETAFNIRMDGQTATGGAVSEALVMSTGLGDLPPGTSAGVRVVYRVPPSVTSFKTIVNLTCLDRHGAGYKFPRTPGD